MNDREELLNRTMNLETIASISEQSKQSQKEKQNETNVKKKKT